MQRKTLLLYGGLAAAGGYLLWRQRSSSGLSGLGSTESDANTLYQTVQAKNVSLDNLLDELMGIDESAAIAGGYETQIKQIRSRSVAQAKQMLMQAEAGTTSWDSALAALKDADGYLDRLIVQIKADIAEPGGAEKLARTTMAVIAKAQEAAEPERLEAEKGITEYALYKATEGAKAAGAAVGKVTGGIIEGAFSSVKGALGKIPWWGWVVGVGGVTLYFGGPLISAWITGRAARMRAVPAPVQANPRRRSRKK